MAVLRFHYMRKLEDELTKDDKNFVMWMSFSSPVTTRNIKHLKNRYSIINYFNYSVATFCAIFFSLTMIAVQYLNLINMDGKSNTLFTYIGTFLFCSTVVYMALAFVIYIFSSTKAKKMSEISLKKALINKQNRLSEKDKEKNKINLRSISYFVYPKVKDLQKGILIILGSF